MWFEVLKRGRPDANDVERSGLTDFEVAPENTKKFFKIILANCKLKLHDIEEDLKERIGWLALYLLLLEDN
ncbi:hypothetical protein TNCV_4420531 [Trichonephila clavipes]|nr:hypothetical protein TNCV_4420531 [Trichonephila clavipes]